MFPNHNIIYQYDGSFEGLLCCIFESFQQKETPVDIVVEENFQMSLTPSRWIATDLEKAKRVAKGIQKNFTRKCQTFFHMSFLTCHPKKEWLMLCYVQMGFQYREKVLSLLTHPVVGELHKAVKYLKNESHFMKEFIRFSDYDGMLVSKVHPNNIVLPMIQRHFCNRYPNESFLIFDESHHMALVHKPNRTNIFPLDSLKLFSTASEEKQYQKLWKQYYNTIGIEERYNPVCRRNHMPKRYWKYMTEFQIILDSQNGD